MVEVDQPHLAVDTGQPAGGIGDKRVGHLALVPSRQLIGVEEGPIQQGHIHLADQAPEIGLPTVPGVDIGAVEQPPGGTLDHEGQGVAEFAAVGHPEGAELQTRAESEPLVRRQGAQFNVAQGDELGPGSLFSQESGHPRGGVHRHPLRIPGFAAQVDQPGVVPGVGVGQQDAGQPAVWGQRLQQVQLVPKVGRGVDQPAPAGLMVCQAEAGHPPALARVLVRGAAVGAIAPGLGQAAVLNGTQQDRFDAQCSSSQRARPAWRLSAVCCS